MGHQTDAWVVVEATDADQPAWRRLFQSYGAVAGDELGEPHLARVWSWIRDPAAQTTCLLLRVGEEPEPVGFAHYRTFERPLAGSIGCYLDDLFVDETVRGRGGARALLQSLADLAATNEWSTVRWTTGEMNRARGLYDTLAKLSPVVTYNMDPAVT